MTAMDTAIEAYDSGDLERAKALCNDALRNGPAPHACLILGLIHLRAGEFKEASGRFVEAQAGAPRDLDFLIALGDGFGQVAMPFEARTAYANAISIEPDPRALRGLGHTLMQLGDWDASRQAYERLRAAAPNAATPLAALADLALRQNDVQQAEAMVQEALARDPQHTRALLLSAQLKMQKAPDSALTLAERALAGGQLNTQQRAQAHGIRGDALEALSRYPDAFAAYEQANAEMRPLASALDYGQSTTPVHIDQLRQYVESQDAVSWAKVKSAAPDPVFLVGFPRSGTTLLGQILAAHPDVETQEESENLADATAVLLLQEPFQPWDDLKPASVDQLRQLYWRRVSEGLGREPSKRVFVDKMPMNAAVLPLVHLLFPNAKILMAVRDPRDVVLSCFKQRFALNSTTAYFLSLDTTVAFYDLVMRSANAARQHLPLQVHEVRYEKLVRNFDGEVGNALKFLGLRWNDNVRNYADAARAARIRTPSAPAVVRPISETEAGKWQNYAAQIASQRSILDAWAKRLGY